MHHLTHYLTNCRLFWIERLCRQQFQIWRKWQKVIQTGRKHCGKRRNCLYEQFLLFPQFFEKACFLGASKGVIVWEWVKVSYAKSIDVSKLKIFKVITVDSKLLLGNIIFSTHPHPPPPPPHTQTKRKLEFYIIFYVYFLTDQSYNFCYIILEKQ